MQFHMQCNYYAIFQLCKIQYQKLLSNIILVENEVLLYAHKLIPLLLIGQFFLKFLNLSSENFHML